MPIRSALAALEAQVARSSQERVAASIGVAGSTVSRWRAGSDQPKGKGREKLLAWAEALPPEPSAPSMADVLALAKLRTEENVVRLGEISGYAKAVLSAMIHAAQQQQAVVKSLAPWVDAEADLRQSIEAADGPDPAATPTESADARPTARRRKAGGR